jgi:hypothetical protein
VDDGCQHYNQESLKFDNVEKKAYRHATVPKISARLNTLLGAKDYLRKHDVLSLYTLCQYDVAHGRFGSSSNQSWCSLFTDEELLQLEYLKDLGSYWEESYGREINEKMACKLIYDIGESIKHKSKHNSTVIGHFRFGHSSTIKFITSFLVRV